MDELERPRTRQSGSRQEYQSPRFGDRPYGRGSDQEHESPLLHTKARGGDNLMVEIAKWAIPPAAVGYTLGSTAYEVFADGKSLTPELLVSEWTPLSEVSHYQIAGYITAFIAAYAVFVGHRKYS